MLRQADRLSRTAPFPKFPADLQEKHSVGDLRLRPFGVSAADLEVDFNLGRRPLQETQILPTCTADHSGSPLPADFFWDLEIGQRTHGLLIIAALSDEAESLTVDLVCPDLNCRQELEIEFSLAELVEMHIGSHPGGVIEVRLGEETFCFRKPTGRDHLEWLGGSFADAKAAVQAMAERLITGHPLGTPCSAGSLAEDCIRDLGEALAAADPWVSFSIRVRCPDCGGREVQGLDLGALALERWRAG